MNRNTHIPNRLPQMLLAFCALGVMPLSAAADNGSGYLQPPIVGWHTLPKAAQPATPVAPVTPRPVSSPPSAPVSPSPALPPPAAEAVVPPVIHAAVVARTPVRPPRHRQSSVQRLLAFQSEAEDPGTFQPILGVEAERSFKNYLKSFTDNSASASSSSATGAGNNATLQGMRSGQTGGNAAGY